MLENKMSIFPQENENKYFFWSCKLVNLECRQPFPSGSVIIKYMVHATIQNLSDGDDLNFQMLQ